MLTPLNILNLIKANKAPYWKVYIIRDYRKNLAGSYSCENCKEDESFDEKLIKSQKALENFLSNFEGDNSVFEMEMRTSKTANQGGVFEGLQFSLRHEKEDNLSGLQNDFSGYIHKGSLESMLDNVRKENQLALERERLNWERKLFEDELKEKKAEIKELETKYNSNSEILKDSFAKAISGLLSGFIEDKNDNISGTPDEDEKNNAANDVAAYLYDNCNKDEIIKIKEIIKNVHAKKRENKQGVAPEKD